MWPTQRILLVSTLVLLVATAGFGSYYLQTSSTISTLQAQISNQSATLSKLMAELHQLQTNQSQSSVAISAELATLSSAINGLGSQSTQQQILIQAIKSEISLLDDLVSKQVGGNISLIQSQVNSLAGVFLGCAGSTPVNYVQPNAQQIRPVLLLKPNSTANVCVTYQTNWSLGITNYSFYHQNFFPNGTYRFGVAIFKTTKGNCTCYSSKASHSFTFAVLPSYVVVGRNTSYVVVMYAITALSNSTGFYDSFSPVDSLVAVGYKAPQVNASDFPYAGLVHPTAVSAFTRIAAAVTGMNVTYLVIPRLVP